MSRVQFAVAFVFAAANLCNAAAEDFVMEELPPHLEERLKVQQTNLLLNRISIGNEYFVDGLKTWDTSQPIRVCFFGGDQQLRSRIAKTAMNWANQGGYVPLDFGNVDNPASCTLSQFFQIRIGFRYKGYWSAVGVDSANLAAQSEQSMNFAIFDIAPPAEPQFTRVVLHEFGHALGFKHEHQSAQSGCEDEFDWNAVTTYLQGPPNYWSIKQIDHNLRPKDPQPTDAVKYDPTSIMLYSFPKEFYIKGDKSKCFTTGNFAISATDATAIQTFYPTDVAKAALARNDVLNEYRVAIDALQEDDDLKSIAKLGLSSIAQGQSDFDSRTPAPSLTVFPDRIFFDQLTAAPSTR